VIIDKEWIAAHIPHQGSMCLLDRVKLWDETGITCLAGSHRLMDNPLRTAGILGITNGIEYAAQAMAIHGALLAGSDKTPNAGFLTSVRDVQWHRARLNDIKDDLTIRAERISGNEGNILYRFDIQAAGDVLLSGRASVMTNAENK
jgi:predicted hotdog family 3-hydroxylacyl-ACP dehydratase